MGQFCESFLFNTSCIWRVSSTENPTLPNPLLALRCPSRLHRERAVPFSPPPPSAALIGGSHRPAKPSAPRQLDPVMVLLQPDPFLNELKNMYERNAEKGSVWVTLKRSSLKCKAKRNKMESASEVIDYVCLVRATDGNKTISTSLSVKDHQRFQASYATILKAHMSALKKRERKDKKKTGEKGKKQGNAKKAAP